MASKWSTVWPNKYRSRVNLQIECFARNASAKSIRSICVSHPKYIGMRMWRYLKIVNRSRKSFKCAANRLLLNISRARTSCYPSIGQKRQSKFVTRTWHITRPCIFLAYSMLNAIGNYLKSATSDSVEIFSIVIYCCFAVVVCYELILLCS